MNHADRTHEAPPKSAFRALRDANIRGLRVRFLEAGGGSAAVLVHGFLASHAVWEGAFPLLEDRFRVIAPDLPGFGESEKPPASRYAYTLGAFAESLVDLLAALGVPRASIVGHRMGAQVALTLAVEHPDVVERLVLVSPELGMPPASAWERLATAPLVGPLFFKQIAGSVAFGRYLEAGHALPGDGDAGRLALWTEAWNTPAAREAAHATLLSMRETRSLVARLSRAKAPTLVCAGNRDEALRLSIARRLARDLPSARLALFDSGASPEAERPAEFGRRVAEFLSERL